MGGGDAEQFAAAAQRLAEEFGSVTATAVDAAYESAARAGRAARAQSPDPARELASLYRPGQMRRRLDQLIETNRRYGHPFGLVVFDASRGRGRATATAGGGQETVLAVVGAALRDSIRLVDEPSASRRTRSACWRRTMTTVEGVQMAERLLGQLDELERGGGLRIAVSAGVVACPEHGGRRRRAAAQGRRGDVAGARGGPAGGRRRAGSAG